MRLVLFLSLGALSAALATPALAGKVDPDDYPLRVHIFRNTSQSRHQRESKSMSETPDYLDGMGVADLFENGQPQGFTFNYSCIDGLKASSGYGTYPARWKKNQKTLEILVPQPGKPWNLETCSLQTQMRPGLVFYWKDNSISEESAAVLKAWMEKHQYDPEKERVDPLPAPGETVAPADSADPQLAGPD